MKIFVGVSGPKIGTSRNFWKKVGGSEQAPEAGKTRNTWKPCQWLHCTLLSSCYIIYNVRQRTISHWMTPRRKFNIWSEFIPLYTIYTAQTQRLHRKLFLNCCDTHICLRLCDYTSICDIWYTMYIWYSALFNVPAPRCFTVYKLQHCKL